MTPDWPFGELPRGEASVVLADPPWAFTNFSPKGWVKGAQNQYACMQLADIQALPVVDLCRPDAVCIMWATAPMLPQAVATMAAWGFVYKTAGAWGKLTKTGNAVAFGTGYIYRSAAEFFLLGTRGKPKSNSRSVRNLILAPVREHSRKPEMMRENIERQFDGPYVELFARERAPGWVAWGNQTEKFEPNLELAL